MEPSLRIGRTLVCRYARSAWVSAGELDRCLGVNRLCEVETLPPSAELKRRVRVSWLAPDAPK